MKDWKILGILAIVGMFITTSVSSFVYAETQQGKIGNNNSTLPLPSPGVNYTIYYPPYDSVNGWGEYWAGNSSTGYIGCAVNGSGEAAALQQLKINVGRVKTLTIDATIKYLAADKFGEINTIWCYFDNDYHYSIIDPWFEWGEIIPILEEIAIAILGYFVPFTSVVLLIADVGLTLLEFTEIVGEQNYSTKHIRFDFVADPHIDNWIKVGLECEALEKAAACGFIKQIKVYGIAPPATPNIQLLSNADVLSTDTPYTFQIVTVDPNDDPVKYIIDWGDGTTTTVPSRGYEKSGKIINVTHSYSETGQYTIKVKAIDCDGMESDWNSIQIEISNHKPKIEEMHVYLKTLFGGWQEIDRHKIPHWRNCRYEFFATDEDENPLKFIIDYDDKTIKESGSTNGIFEDYHRYIYPRSYSIIVNVTDGLSYDVKDFDIYVTNSWWNSSGNITSIYQASMEIYPPGEANIWTYDYGDGTYGIYVNGIANETVQENLTTSFYYIKPNNSSQRYIPGEQIYGEYGLLGEFGSMQQDVVADYNYSPSYIEEGQEIYFTDESYSFGENIISWSWDFGDGNTSNEQNPSHVYSSSGNYIVTLTVTTESGNSSGISRNVYIASYGSSDGAGNNSGSSGGNEGSGSSGEDEQYILADFTYSPSNPEVNEMVNFYDASNGNIVSWEWNFGDGATSNEQNPSHSYSQEGTYCVSLTVTDNNGNSSGIMRFIVVSENNGNQGSGQQGSGGGQNS